MSERNRTIETVLSRGETYPVTPNNLFLYKHIGKSAIYDHCYVRTPNGGGIYVWRGKDGYDSLSQAAVIHEATLCLNLQNPEDADVQNYFDHHTIDLEGIGHTPDWLEIFKKSQFTESMKEIYDETDSDVKDMPFAKISIGGESVAVKRTNLTLVTYVGKNALFNHCYVEAPNGGGGYIWLNPSLQQDGDDLASFESYSALAYKHQAEMALNVATPKDRVLLTFNNVDITDMPSEEADLYVDDILSKRAA